MKVISLLLVLMVTAIIFYTYCDYQEKAWKEKQDISRSMLYITMLDALANSKEGKQAIEILLTSMLKSEVEYIGKENTNANIYLICDSWTQKTENLIRQKSIEYNLSEISQDFIKGSSILTDICNKYRNIGTKTQ